MNSKTNLQMVVEALEKLEMGLRTQDAETIKYCAGYLLGLSHGLGKNEPDLSKLCTMLHILAQVAIDWVKWYEPKKQATGECVRHALAAINEALKI